MPSQPAAEGPAGHDGAFICGHFAKESCVLVPFGQERCRVIFRYYRGLKAWEGSLPDQQPLPALTSEMSPCRAGHTCVAWLAQQSFSWLILHFYTLSSTLGAAHRALAGAYSRNNLDVHALQIDFKKARRQDRDRIMTRLKLLTNKNPSTLTASLLYKDADSSYPVKELATAFTIRVRSLDLVPEGGHSNEVNSFLRTAATLLQRLAERPPDCEIPPWSITSFDVTFDADDRRVVGRGGFGRVVEGEWNGQLVAVKEISKKTDRAWVMDNIRHEVQIWSRLSHPNILPFYGACLEASKPFLVSQLCPAGNALKYIQRFPYVNRTNLLHDIAVGMIYLHKQSIIHADLKASNILIGPAGEALIADFGLSHVQDQVSSSVHVTRTSADRVGGTFRWMAPEVLLGGGVNKPVDLYGFALVAWELYMGGAAVPFGCIADAKMFKTLVQQGERPERPLKMGDEMWGLVQRCWRGDPCERPDFVQVERTLLELKLSHADRDNMSRMSDDAAASRRPICSPSMDVSPMRPTTPVLHSPLFPPKKRRASLSVTTEAITKSPFLQGLMDTTILAFSRSPTKTRDVDKNRRPSDDYGFTASLESCKVSSLCHFFAYSEAPEAQSMDAVLTFLYNHSLSADGLSEILDQTTLIPAMLTRLPRKDLPENERYLICGLLANLACHGKGRTAIAAQPNAISALHASLVPVSTTPALENATRYLYNLSTDGEGHRLIAASNVTIASLGYLLSKSSSTHIVKNVLGCFTNLSHKEPGRSAISSASEAIDAVLQTLRPGTDAIMKEQALMCIGNLSVDEKGVAALLVHPDLISGLSTCLCEESLTPAIKAQALRCLRNLAKSADSHALIWSRLEVLSAVCDVLAIRIASNHQKYALHFMHRFTASDVGKAWLRDEKRLWGSLRWFVDNGFTDEQTWAAECLQMVQDLL